MKIIHVAFFIISFLALPLQTCAQGSTSVTTKQYENPYNNCAAIIYNGKMLVDSYSPSGKCILSADQTGTISAATVELSEKGGTPKKAIEFQVAIKNTMTNTLWMYSREILDEVRFEDVLAKCQKGDKIVILTVDQEYSLTHHEIEINWIE